MLRQRRICAFAHTAVPAAGLWPGSAGARAARSEYVLGNIAHIVHGGLRGVGEACGGEDDDDERGLGTDGAAAAGEAEAATWELPSADLVRSWELRKCIPPQTRPASPIAASAQSSSTPGSPALPLISFLYLHIHAYIRGEAPHPL